MLVLQCQLVAPILLDPVVRLVMFDNLLAGMLQILTAFAIRHAAQDVDVTRIC